jgi:hypothetical protein
MYAPDQLFPDRTIQRFNDSTVQRFNGSTVQRLIRMHIQVGIITISDRASKGLYDDLGGPALKKAAE